MTPTVSVIIPTFNRCKMLEDAVRSVLDQTYRNFELIIVDDGSTDNTREMLTPYLCDSRVRYVHQAHASARRARNTGIKASSGRYLAFLDSDDTWSSEKLDRQLNAMYANPDVSVVYCACCIQHLDSKSREVSEVVCRPPPPRASLYEDLLYGCVIIGGASSVLVDAACIAKVGMFDETTPASDWDMWTRMALSHQFHYLDVELVQVRKHSTNMSNVPEMSVQVCELRLDMLKDQVPAKFRFHLLPVKGAYYATCALRCLRRRRYLLALKMIARLIPFAILHPVSIARGVRVRLQMQQPRSVRRKLKKPRS